MLGVRRKATEGEGRSQGGLPPECRVWYMVWYVFVMGVYGVLGVSMVCVKYLVCVYMCFVKLCVCMYVCTHAYCEVCV
jgi:hypothetical protein